MLEVPHLSACDRVVPLLVDEVAVGFLSELGLYLAQLRVRQIVIFKVLLVIVVVARNLGRSAVLVVPEVFARRWELVLLRVDAASFERLLSLRDGEVLASQEH